MSTSTFDVRVISSPHHDGTCLSVNGKDITSSSPHGAGCAGTGHGSGPFDYFKLTPPPAGSEPYETTIESLTFPNVFLRMDGTGVTASSSHGGLVNLQFGGSGAYEKFKVHRFTDGTVAFEATAFPGVYLSMQMPDDGVSMPDNARLIEIPLPFWCSFGVGHNEKFVLNDQPATNIVRVLTYNTHLMKGSFIEKGSDVKREFTVSHPQVFEDVARCQAILRKVIKSNADVVSLQEVWDIVWEDGVIRQMAAMYPYACNGPVSANPLYTQTSGVVLLSKFPLSDVVRIKYHGMDTEEDMTSKGILSATIDIPLFGKLRIGTTHAATDTGGDNCANLIGLALNTVVLKEENQKLPALLLGDFNVHPGKRDAMRAAFSFSGVNTFTAIDGWKTVHPNAENHTVDMRYNTLDQFFSPDRDTAGPSVIDYIWTKPGDTHVLTPKAAVIPRDWNYQTQRWYWAHSTLATGTPAAVAKGDILLVLTRDGGRNAMDRSGLMYSRFDRTTQQWKHGYTGFNSSSSAGMFVYENAFHLFYRDPMGNGIFHRSSADGTTWSNAEYIGYDTGGRPCPVLYKGKIYLLHVDKDGKGGMIFSIVKTGSGWGKGNWTGYQGIGITCRGDMSAAVYDNTLCVVCHEGTPGNGSRIMTSVRTSHDGGWNPGHRNNMKSAGTPGIIAEQDRFRMYYRHSDGNAIFSAWSVDGINWYDRDVNTKHDRAADGVTPVLWDEKTILFYGDEGGNYFRQNSLLHATAGDIPLDLSDHYPLMVDFALEQRAVQLHVSVYITGSGNARFADADCAGTKGEDRALQGFQIDSKIPNLGLCYKAHISNFGDTDWINSGTYAGTKGESKVVEGFCIELTGSEAPNYKLSYQAHISETGDTQLCNAGEYCGTRGEKKSVQMMRVVLEKIK